jgi:hypothetical protein
MASSALFRGISAVQELITKPLVLEVLDGLGHEIAPREAVPADAGSELLDEAVEYLRRLGVVRIDAQPGPAHDATVALTSRGQDLLYALRQLSQT